MSGESNRFESRDGCVLWLNVSRPAEYYFPMFIVLKLLVGSAILYFWLIKARSVLVYRTSIVKGQRVDFLSPYTLTCAVICFDFDKCPCLRGQM